MLLNILFPLIAKISAVKSVPTAKWKMQLDALKKNKKTKNTCFCRHAVNRTLET